jgi:hypothetical protein
MTKHGFLTLKIIEPAWQWKKMVWEYPSDRGVSLNLTRREVSSCHFIIKYICVVHLLSEGVPSREDASTSWPSSSGLRGHRRTYLTMLESADYAWLGCSY